MGQHRRRWALGRSGRVGLVGVLLLGAGLGMYFSGGSLDLSGGGVRTIPVAVGALLAPPTSVAELVATVGASVVHIQARAPRTQVRRGSGVILSTDGDILTTSAVVAGARAATVTSATGKRYVGRVLGRDSQSGLALIKITPSEPLPMARLGDSDRLWVGEQVVAVGNPSGRGPIGTTGLLRTTLPGLGAEHSAEVLLTDAPLLPESLGGPLLTMQGEVVGITRAPGSTGKSLGGVVPINRVRHLLAVLKHPGGKDAYPLATPRDGAAR